MGKIAVIHYIAAYSSHTRVCVYTYMHTYMYENCQQYCVLKLLDNSCVSYSPIPGAAMHFQEAGMAELWWSMSSGGPLSLGRGMPPGSLLLARI